VLRAHGGLGEQRRCEQAAEGRDRLEALEREAAGRLRRLVGGVLAADIDRQFVLAFACAGGRVVGRRRLPSREAARVVRAAAGGCTLALAASPSPLQSGRHRPPAHRRLRPPRRDVTAIPLAVDRSIPRHARRRPHRYPSGDELR
jgi:hypothetical protein